MTPVGGVSVHGSVVVRQAPLRQRLVSSGGSFYHSGEPWFSYAGGRWYLAQLWLM